MVKRLSSLHDLISELEIKVRVQSVYKLFLVLLKESLSLSHEEMVMLLTELYLNEVHEKLEH
jgi:SUMO ligase MMS21 Smc5/6 complex component